MPLSVKHRFDHSHFARDKLHSHMTQDRSSLIPMKTALFAFLLTMGLTLPWVGSAQTKGVAVTNPVISVTPTNLNFGIIGVGRTKDLVVTIENVGGGTLAGSARGKD